MAPPPSSSSNSQLMNTERGGEGGQYEGDLHAAQPKKTSGGQLGTAGTTTDPAQTDEGLRQKAERGEQTAENLRYGQAISERGVGGMTDGSVGSGASAEREGYGRVEGREDEAGSASEEGRTAAGYVYIRRLACVVTRERCGISRPHRARRAALRFLLLVTAAARWARVSLFEVCETRRIEQLAGPCAFGGAQGDHDPQQHHGGPEDRAENAKEAGGQFFADQDRADGVHA
nr:hypothetical protein CFP56_57593 [Quercus suber]